MFGEYDNRAGAFEKNLRASKNVKTGGVFLILRFDALF